MVSKCANRIRKLYPPLGHAGPVSGWKFQKTATGKYRLKTILNAITAPKPPNVFNGVVRPETYDIQPQGYCLRHTTECNSMDAMTYDINSGFDKNDQYSSWFLWPMFSFQVYPGNLLNTYHWRAVDADHVVVWRVGILLAAQKMTSCAKWRSKIVKPLWPRISVGESVQRGLKSRGYVRALVVDPKCGVNSEHSILTLQRWMKEAVDV